MTATSIPTVPLYLRLPAPLRERLDAAARGEQSWIRKGAIADTAIKALAAGLDALAGGDPRQLRMFGDAEPDAADSSARRANGHKVKRRPSRSSTKHARKPTRTKRAHKAKRIAKGKRSTKRGRK